MHHEYVKENAAEEETEWDKLEPTEQSPWKLFCASRSAIMYLETKVLLWVSHLFCAVIFMWYQHSRRVIWESFRLHTRAVCVCGDAFLTTRIALRAKGEQQHNANWDLTWPWHWDEQQDEIKKETLCQHQGWIIANSAASSGGKLSDGINNHPYPKSAIMREKSKTAGDELSKGSACWMRDERFFLFFLLPACW